jgi:manganese/zinc/iron transport system substrate-binding protein
VHMEEVMKKILCAAALLLAMSLGACTQDTEDNPNNGSGKAPYQAVATVGMVGDIVENVAGEKVSVSAIMGPGVDPHLYTATRDDVAEMMGADVIFYAGLLLEGRMIDTLVAVGRSKPVYAVTELIDEKYLLEPPGFGGHHDPHVWMDVSAWSRAVEAVAYSLAEFDPPNAAFYQRNADAYQKKLATLHEYGRARIGTIPAQEPGDKPGNKPIMITSHDAFNYFGRAYGLNVLGVQGISTESEAGLKQINDLIDLIVKNNVPAVFVESSISPQNVLALVEGARARGHDVEIGGELYSDAMGPQGTYEGTYIGMLDHNITTATRALGGKAPARGMQGELTPDE